jgi:hypothetical protein
MKKFIVLILFVLILFFTTGQAFAYHSTISVTGKQKMTQLSFMTRNGLEVQVEVKKNTGQVLMRYFQVVKQVSDGGDNYTNYFGTKDAHFLSALTPDKNWAIFITFNINQDGVDYHCFRNTKIAYQATNSNNLVGLSAYKMDKKIGHFTSPKIQDFRIRFNYPQPIANGSYSKLTYFRGFDKKVGKYVIQFHAVDGLSYVLFAERGNEFDNIAVVSKKGKNPLIDLFGSHYGKKNFYSILYGLNKKKITFFYPQHKNGMIFGTLHPNNTIDYHFSQN